jgi:hypothetical protein
VSPLLPKGDRPWAFATRKARLALKRGARFPAARRGPDENHPAEAERSVSCHLLRDHSAE